MKNTPITAKPVNPTLQPNHEHEGYAEFLPEWQLVSDCVDGERKVKSRGEAYLPHPTPSVKGRGNQAAYTRRYDQYRARANFFNATGRTLSGLMGIAFSSAPVYDLESGLEGLLDNADGEGQTLDQMVREALKQNLMRGRGGLLADSTGDGNQTIARPALAILRQYTSTGIINWSVRDGKLELLVLREKNALPMTADDFVVKLETVLREFRLIDGKVYARYWSDNGSDKFVSEFGLTAITDARSRQLEEIPFAWYGSSSNDWTIDSPPLADLANVNIKHYINEANIAESCHLVGQPMLKLIGLSDDWVENHLKEGIAVGSNEAVLLGANMDMAYVQANENTMQITNAARLEKHMAMIGAKLIEKGTATKTATQAGDEAQTDNSVLSLCASNVEAAFNTALRFISLFAGTAGESKITLNKQYEVANIDAAGLSAMISGVQQGKIRMEDLLAWQQKNGILPSNVKIDEVIAELESVTPTLEKSNIVRDEE